MLYRVALESANLIKVVLVTAAAMLAICLLALVETMNKAEAKDSLPENGKIVFADHPGQGYIYTVDPDGSSLSRLAKDAILPAVSPDGTKIAYNSFEQIWVMDADGSNKRKLPLHSSRGASYMNPTWSSDGTKLAFNINSVQTGLPDIYTSDADGSDLTNLTKNPDGEEWQPAFSPNGQQICFTGGADSYNRGGIYVMNSDGSNPTRLAGSNVDRYEDQYAAQGCDWSPDGTKIAYTYFPPLPPVGSSAPQNTDVYIMNADGSRKINLTKTPAVEEFNPNWSPDGTKIAFQSNRDGSTEVYKMNADGSNPTRLTDDLGVDGDSDWQPLTPKSRSMRVHQPDTGGLSLLLVAIALLFSSGVMFYAGLKRRV
jgi:dipeptidyl aminopeptidase/acylaminoacyl peptidase